jgi:hypothetical protein
MTHFIAERDIADQNILLKFRSGSVFARSLGPFLQEMNTDPYTLLAGRQKLKLYFRS